MIRARKERDCQRKATSPKHDEQSARGSSRKNIERALTCAVAVVGRGRMKGNQTARRAGSRYDAVFCIKLCVRVSESVRVRVCE